MDALDVLIRLAWLAGASLLASAGARVRWFATDGNHDLAGLDATDAARIEPASAQRAPWQQQQASQQQALSRQGQAWPAEPA